MNDYGNNSAHYASYQSLESITKQGFRSPVSFDTIQAYRRENHG